MVVNWASGNAVLNDVSIAAFADGSKADIRDSDSELIGNVAMMPWGWCVDIIPENPTR
jgi:hypothetical protein